MRVHIKELEQAYALTRAVSSLDKRPVGVLLEIKGTILRVRYANGKKMVSSDVTILFRMPTEINNANVVINNERLGAILRDAKSTGSLKTMSVDLVFNTENKTIDFIIIKDMAVNDGVTESYETCIKKTLTVPYRFPDEEVKYHLLARANYTAIYNMDLADEINRHEVLHLFKQAADSKAPLINVSAKNKCAFTYVNSYLIEIPLKENYSRSLCVNTATAKLLVTVLAAMNGESVKLRVEGNTHLLICDEDGDIGVSVDMIKTTTGHLNALNTYKTRDYKDYQLTMYLAALRDVLKGTVPKNITDKTMIRFRRQADAVNMCVKTDNIKQSIACSFELGCYNYYECDGNDIETLEIALNLKMLQTILSKCTGYLVAFDVSILPNNSLAIRLGNLDEDVFFDEFIPRMERSSADKMMKMEHRKDYLSDVYYFHSTTQDLPQTEFSD